MAVILVLGLLAITLSLSYAMLRTQTTSARIQANHGTRIDALPRSSACCSRPIKRAPNAMRS
jgi:hypothetical protein